MKQIIKDYFNFTKLERIGVIVVIFLLVSIFFLPDLMALGKPSDTTNADTAWANSIRKLKIKNNDSGSDADKNTKSYYATERKTYKDYTNAKTNPDIRLLYFNPNTISVEEWQKLGIKEKTIRNIRNYLTKGGNFKKPEDLQKIYSLSKSDYERVFPFIKIDTNSSENSQHYSDTKKFEAPSKTFKRSVIDINIADTSALIALPGIGSKLATRIVTFRDKLGGFHSVDQLKETYGLQDSVFQKIKQYLTAYNGAIKKININAVSIDELKTHPYLKYNIANAIIAYRNEHGPFSSKEDLKKIMVVTDEVYNKIAPYIIVQ